MAIQCPRLRTLLLRKNEGLTSICESFFKKLRYLAVLDLSETAIRSLPKSTENLRSLKFLNLSRTKIQNLPKSLSCLRSLQFLDVSQCEDLQTLHSGIGDHKYMLHLNVKGCKRLESLPAGVSELRSLRTLRLRGVVLKRKKTAKSFQLTDVKNLTHLQHLSITFNEESISSSDFLKLKTWQGMTKMRTLTLEYVPSSRKCCSVPADLGNMENLETLTLKNCRLEPDRDWISQLPNLRVLVLESNDEFSADPYRSLHRFPNLKMLRLSSNESCVEFPQEFREPYAFPRLKKLEIEDFKGLKYFPSIEDKAMPKLKQLIIKHCDQLNCSPSGLERLANLQELELDERLLVDLEIGDSWKKLKKLKIKRIPPSETASSSLPGTGTGASASESEGEAESDMESELESETEQSQPAYIELELVIG